MAVLGLRFCARAFSSCGEWGPLFIAVRGPLTIEASLLRSTGSRRAGSAIVAHGPSCPAACGIFPDQGSNPCPLHWQADSQPLRHQGSPLLRFFKFSKYAFAFICLFGLLFIPGSVVILSYAVIWPLRSCLEVRSLWWDLSVVGCTVGHAGPFCGGIPVLMYILVD